MVQAALNQPRPPTWRVWLLTLRPATLPAGAVPVLVGSAVAHAHGALRWPLALLALAGALLLQIGCNFVNDAADFAKGADTAERLGPARATQRGWLTQRQVYAAAAWTFVLALIAGATLAGAVWREGHGTTLLGIGIASLACAVGYTAGPKPLGYLGLGDVLVFVFFGPVAVCGTAWLQIGRVTEQAVCAAIPVGALATAILVVNNLRDRDGDARAGKRTLAVRLGAGGARLEYKLLLILAFLVPLAAWLLHIAGPGWLAPWLALPLAWQCTRAVGRLDGAALNPWLGGTARLELLYGLLLAAGVAA